MKELLDNIERWHMAGEEVALITIVRTAGSTPRPRGAKMAISASGKIAGSISGGCLESDIYEEAMQVLADGTPRLLHYGISDEMAFTVGLSCGGEVDVFVEPVVW